MLEQIVAKKRVDVAERMRSRPLESFRSILAPSDRSLFDAMFVGPAFIFECKKASPSEGLIRQDFDIEQIAKTYAPFASAISVITDEPFFQGSLEYLSKVRAQVSCPVLCKDFVVDPYQVYEARRYGADAILLMMSVLNDEEFSTCFSAAQELNVDALVEVHDEVELKRATALGAKIIGINNRNLKTLKVNLETVERLSPLPLAGEGRVRVVAESGYKNHAEIRAHQKYANAFLVGTSLMRQQRLDLAIRELIFGRVKICGLTNVQDARVAYEYGATFGGLIFAKESPRCVAIERAKDPVSSVPLRWVGVFVNEPVETVASIARELGLYAVQLHGEESESYCAELKRQLNGCEIWKALRVGPSPQPSPHAVGRESWDRVLLDNYSGVARGGTGQAFDWSVINQFGGPNEIVLSGGLSPENISKADELGVWALDVNSKVEESPGVKNHERVNELFAQINPNKNGVGRYQYG